MKEVTCQGVMNSGSQERCKTWNKQYIIFVICAVAKTMKEVTCQGVMNSGSQERCETWNKQNITFKTNSRNVFFPLDAVEYAQ